MNRRIEALWLIKGLGRGGAEKLLVDLAGSLPTDDVGLHVAYVLPYKDALVPDLRERGVQVQCLSEQGPWPAALRRLLTQRRFDVVHTHSPVVASAARVLAPRGTVLVHTEHNMWSRYRWPTRVANALTASRCQIIWAVSEGVARSVRPVTLRGRTPEVRVLLHGLPDTKPADSPHARQDARKLLELEESAFVLGTVGNLTLKKDHDSLVDAFGLLHANVPEARLVIVGGGPREEHLRALVRSRRLDEAVVLTGVRDDVPSLLPGFDVFTMSSRYEGLSIALLEAMAAGVPPVVTDVGGMPEVVTNRVDGLVVPPGRPQAMAVAWAELEADEELRSVFAAAARRRASQFGIGPAADALLAAYQELRGTAARVATP